jgi:hypothetical protein
MAENSAAELLIARSKRRRTALQYAVALLLVCAAYGWLMDLLFRVWLRWSRHQLSGAAFLLLGVFVLAKVAVRAPGRAEEQDMLPSAFALRVRTAYTHGWTSTLLLATLAIGVWSYAQRS